jgi:cytochrome c
MRTHNGILAAGTLVIIGLTLASAQAARQRGAAPSSSPPGCSNPAATIALKGASCGAVQPLQLSCAVPPDMQVSPSGDLNVMQRSADVFSWQEFIAVNWPASDNERGVPDVRKTIASPGPRVWETWKEASEVYLPGGGTPPAWNVPERSACSAAAGRRAAKTLMRTQKIHDGLDSNLQAAASDGTLPATLTDQRGRLVRYEIRFNKVAFDYIVSNKLYDPVVQAGATSIAFPSGAMLAKAAWREVTREEEGQFHTVDACVCEPGPDGTATSCSTARMGLVGLHITQKTPSAPQWIWSTFEHIANVPGASASGPFSFHNPASTARPNQQTEPGTPNQLTRTQPIPSRDPDCGNPQGAVDNVQRMNDEVRGALASSGSVFAKYQLVNTQWPVPPAHAPPSTAFSVRPLALANTTMESYVQNESSCMGCHATARTVNANTFVSSDFSFTLNNARPTPASCRSVGAPVTPATDSERAAWPEIMRGYTIATRTYETLPAFVPEAKLHCASCHLDGGGNSSAAWWVGLKDEYPTTPKLQARINHCFTNSLNGKALCEPASDGSAGNCDKNADMGAILRYIAWLDDQAKREPLCPSVSHGYPPIATLTGNAARGEEIFATKCAVCHGPDGQGRYERGVYFRPALWGPHSFNASAGMFAYPEMLAGFLRWNMPLGAGGSLTDQEAWDLQAFLHAKPRPGEK